MTITDIMDFDKKRRKVYVDGELAFVLYLGELRKYNIIPDREITMEEFEEISSIVIKRAKKRALFILKSNWKTKKQLLDKLMEGGYTAFQASEAVAYAQSYGYIDDSNYALNFAQANALRSTKQNMRMKLLKRGIDKELIDETLSEIEVDENELIDSFLRKKGHTRENLWELDIKEKNRIYAALIRKGFSLEVVSGLFR